MNSPRQMKLRSVSPAPSGPFPHSAEGGAAGAPRVVQYHGSKAARRAAASGYLPLGCTESITEAFAYVFLPTGYPDSVTEDYSSYQMYDTLQALCSGITGTLAMRAVFLGHGVGDAAATTSAATLTWLARDGLGSIGRIAFASTKGSELDSDCKRWRLVADITNDFGIFLEILTSYLPAWLFLPLVCIASVSKAICGVCGGATKASLTQHFARQNNTADVSAKDGTQETAVGLTGILIGTLVTLLPDTFALTWWMYFLFTALHLLANYRGVRSVVLASINRQRLELCLQRGFACTPKEVSRDEAILRYSTCDIRMGVAMDAVPELDVDRLAAAEEASVYTVVLSEGGATAYVLFNREGHAPAVEVAAYCAAWYMLREGMSEPAARDAVDAVNPIGKMRAHGWDLDTVLLNSDEYRYELVGGAKAKVE